MEISVLLITSTGACEGYQMSSKPSVDSNADKEDHLCSYSSGTLDPHTFRSQNDWFSPFPYSRNEERNSYSLF